MALQGIEHSIKRHVPAATAASDLTGDLDDSPGSQEGVTVDVDAIEQQKENIQPLSTGRSAKALHSIFTSDRKALQDELKEGHDKFNAEIEQVEADGTDDPLDVYHRYVRWTLSSYPTGPSHASHLVPLLERSTRRFVHEEQYRSDIRLLKLWLLYAKYVDRPKDIFRFLEGLQVGTKLASFYEEWALLEEQHNDFPTADSIYNLGIARRAQPLERLKKRRDAFQARMLLPRPIISPEEPSSALSRSTSGQRSILGASAGGSSTSTTGAFKGTASHHSSSRAALPNNGASAFAVFKDGDETGGRRSAHETQDGWTDFGTNASRKRENERAAVPWRGETIPLQQNDEVKALSTSTSMRFEVFRDENADKPAADLGTSHHRETPSLSRSLRGPGEAELLRLDPFRHYAQDSVKLADVPDVAVSMSAPKSISAAKPVGKTPSSQSATRISQSKSSGSSKASSSSSLAKSSDIKRTERVASPLHDIYPEGADGPEISFEELQASRRQLRDLRSGHSGQAMPVQDAPWQQEAQSSGIRWSCNQYGDVLLRHPVTGKALFKYLQEEDDEADRRRKRQEEEQEEEQRRRRMLQLEEERLQQEALAEAAAAKEREIMEANISEPERSASPADSAQFGRPASPTIHTKAALEEVNAMFGRTMRFDGEENEDESHDSSATEISILSVQDDALRGLQDGTPLLPSQVETDGSFWSMAQSQSQQPFFSQQSLGSQSQSQSSSQGYGSANESGEVTEESEEETENSLTQDIPVHYGNSAVVKQGSFSRSTSSGSSRSLSSYEEPVPPAQATTLATQTPFTPNADNSAISDGRRDVLQQHPGARSAFKPTRAPVGSALAFVQPTNARAFQVFQELDGVAQSVDQDSENAEYDLGRRPGGVNRFASMMDVMTPITERTCEFGMPTTTMSPFNVFASTSQSPASTNASQEHTVLAVAEPEADSSGMQKTSGDDEGQASIVQMDLEHEQPQTAIAHSMRSLPCDICDPHAAHVIEKLLSSPHAHPSQWHNFRDQRTTPSRKLEGLQRMARSRRKASTPGSANRSSLAHDEALWELTLDSDNFVVREKLGEGGYGAVFRVAELTDGLFNDDSDDAEGAATTQIALKVETPPNIWEFHIINTIQHRLPERTRASIVKPHRLYAFQDESYMLLDYCDQGSLLDAVNHAHDAGIGPAGSVSTGMDELLAIFFTIELTRILECLHTYRFLHGDFKIDNCLIRLDEVPGGAARNWTNSYKRDGTGGWKHKGVTIIDFGRAVDLMQFPQGQMFTTTVKTDHHDCPEVREGQPWVYQPDYFGLACIAHVLLFGKYLETVEVKAPGMADPNKKRYCIKEPLKRYHQAALWTRFFDLLLNPTFHAENDASKAITPLLKETRHNMENWLEQNADKHGKSLKGLLIKLEIWALSSH